MALTKEQIRIMDGITGLNSDAAMNNKNVNTNTNSLSDEDIKRMDEITGLAQYQAPQKELTLRERIIQDDPIKAKEYEDKGPITPYEAALDASREFNGTYDKVIQRPKSEGSIGLNPLGKTVSEFLDDKLPAVKKALKSLNNASQEAAKSEIEIEQKQAELNKARQGVDENDKTKRYEITSYDKLGRPIYSEIDLLDKIGFAEAMREDMIKGTALGSYLEGASDKRAREIKDKILKGETIYQDELDFLNNRYDKEREKVVRGYSTAGKIGSGVGLSLGLGADIIVGSMLAEVLGVGALAGSAGLKTYLGLRGANAGIKAASMGAKAAEFGVRGTLAPLVTTAVNAPHRLTAEYQGRMLNNEIELTDTGNLIFKESDEKPATAFFKSLGKLYIMYFTEMAGGEMLSAAANGIGKGISNVASPVIKNLFNKFPALEPLIKKTSAAFAKKYEELNKLPVLGKSADWLKNTAHFDGFLEECGEEALEDVLNLVAGTNNEERSLENYAKAIFKTPEEWAVIAGSILIQGAGLSAANYIIANNMAKNGKSKEEIQETLDSISQSQANDIIDDLIKNDAIKINELNTPEEEAAERRQAAVERISQGFQSNNIKDKRLADATGNLVVSMLEKASETINAPIEELIEKEAPQIRTVDEVGYAQENTPTRSIDARLSALEQEFNNLSQDENFDLDKFNELENEYNELLNLRNQGQELYQPAQTAGAQEGKNLEAAKEWKEKGTESKYFKKWSGDNYVVKTDEADTYKFKTGNSVVVEGFHQTNSEFDTFNTDFEKAGKYDDELPSGHFFKPNNKDIGLGGSIQMQCYIKFDNPLVFNSRYDASRFWSENISGYKEAKKEIDDIDKEYNSKYEALHKAKRELYSELRQLKNEGKITEDEYKKRFYAQQDEMEVLLDEWENKSNVARRAAKELINDYIKNSGYDGIILNHDEGSFGRVIKSYIALNPEQIKSVDNRGTFDAENPNIYYQAATPDFVSRIAKTIDRLKTILRSKKISELANEFEFFNTFSDELKDAQDYYIDNLPESYKSGNTRGVHVASAKAIYINFDVIGNDFIKFIRTLAHEAKHATQYRQYKEAKNKKKKTKKDLEIINNYEYCEKANVDRQKYFRKNKKILNKIFKNTRGLSQNKKNEYFKNLKLKELNTYNEYTKLYEKYYNSVNETEARKAGDNAKRKAENFDTGLLEKVKSSYGRFRERYVGTGFGNQFKRNRSGRRYQSEFEGNGLRYFQSAYTGSPVKYEKPSLDYIGTGEGAQAHGWGLYYAEDREVAEGYRKRLSDTFIEPKYDGKTISQAEEELYKAIISFGKDKLLKRRKERIKEYQEYLEENKDAITSSNREWYESSIKRNKDEIEQIENFDESKYKKGHRRQSYLFDNKELNFKDSDEYDESDILDYINQEVERVDKDIDKVKKNIRADLQYGQLYKDAYNLIKNAKSITDNSQLFEVDIPDKDVLLDEDKKLNEQPEKVRKAIYEYMKDNSDTYNLSVIKDFNNLPENLNGRQFYKQVTIDINGNEKDASLKLNDYGIKGITYDGRQDGRCYVIFDDKAVKVLQKFYQFAGENSETADKYSLKNAKKMLKDGVNPETVRKETGWFKGVDGKFRYEISDNDAVVNIDRVKKARQDEIDYINLNITDYNTRMSYLVQQHDAKEISDEDFREQYDSLMNRKLEEVDNLRYYENKAYASYLSGILDHEKLYAAYPSLRTIRVEFKPLEFGVMGQYSEKNREIIIAQVLMAKGEEAELKKVLMHEIQHFIQHQEGFAVGGNQSNVEIILADAKDAINNSKDSKEYDFIMKKYSIVNNLLLIRSIQDKPENITKSYWWMQQGKGWYAPRKTRKKERAKYINDCCQEFIDYSIQKHKDNNTFEGYKNYSKKDTAELKKEARRLNYRAGKVLDKLSPDYKNLSKIEHALNQLDRYEVNTFDLYKRLAGETEARNTESRVNLSDKERLEKAPSETADVPSNEQLVIFDDGTEAFSESNDMSDNSNNNDIQKEIRKIKGSYIPTERIIELFKDADESTIVHELAHWYLDLLNKYAPYSEELTEDLDKVRAFLKNDGGEFTREQHEKFARSFEAYIRTGYAKNNRLKKIFDDFKNWLISIYDDIKKIVYTENGVDKYFTDDEVKTIQNLFDRLLTTEKERIRTTVFDKINEVENKINEIKENEKKELDELDKIYKDNISALNRQSDKKRNVQEYLDLADKMTSRETQEVKEFKERYKKATLEILSTATGYDKKFIANSRNWEKVQLALEKAEDKITISGFNPEWGEFYSSNGVTYENDELGADYNLATQAFDVLVNGEYNKTYDENYEFEDINKFSAKVDYLVAKVKTLKGEEKNIAIEAMFSLFNEMPSMPDEVAQSLLNQVTEVAQAADEEQKEDFNSRAITSIDVIQQLQYYVTKKLSDLKVYNPETRYKMRLSKSHRLYRYIKDIKSVNSAKKQIRRINEFVIDDMRNNQRSLLHKEIQKQLKINSKLVKVGTISKGKFDWRTNTIFAELVELNKLKREEAEAQLGALIQIQDAAKGEDRDSFNENETAEFNKTNDFEKLLKNKFLQYRSMKVQDLDVEHTILLLQDILELKEKGRQAKSEEDFKNKTLKWNTKNNLLEILDLTQKSGAAYGANWVSGVGKITSLNGGTLANWESLLNAIFNKDTAQKYSLLGDEAKSDIYARKHILNFYERACEIYGFNKPTTWDRFLDYDNMQPIIKLFQDYDNEKYTYIQKVYSINSPDGFARSSIEISRAQIITMYTWALNDKLEQRLFNQFGIEQIREMFENVLSDKDKELAWALIDTCETMREDINEVFIRTTGLSLPSVENYFPSKAERVQSDIDLFHDNFVKSSNPSFIKERKICNRIPMKPLSPLEILIPHINKTAKYVVMSEKVNFLNQVFKDTAIKTKMQEIWGSKNGADIYQTLINKLAACTFTNYAKGTNLVAGSLDLLSRNYITSAIGFSPKVTLGQLLSVVNYAENMPVGVWAKGFIETLKNPVKNFKYMLDNCEYLQARLAGNSQNEVIAILTSEKDKFRTLRNFMTSNVKWGDIIAITLGGKPYVDYLMQQGMEKEAAFDKFVEDTLRAQQAGTTSAISEWQSEQARTPLTRMFFAFRNTDMQYERKFIDTIIQGKKGEIGKKELMKKIFIYKILNPFMFTAFLQNMALVALIRGLFAGDDPDDILGGFITKATEAVMLGGLNAYGFAGFIASSLMETLIAAFDKEFKHFEKEVPVMSDFDYQAKKIAKGDLSFADYVDAVALGSEFVAGVPATKVVNALEGVGDVAQGEFGIGLSRMAGWGEYTATNAWTGKKPKKRK